jgi:hypothetical protein
MANRHLPVRPDLQQLRHQAKDLLHAIRQEDPLAIEDLREHTAKAKEPATVKLADAQLTVARSYGVRSWPRLVLACKVIDSIWEDRSEELRELVMKHPYLRDEMARGTESCNWGPPMSYAANLGRDGIIEMLRALGATDIVRAMGRAVLHGQISTARKLHAMGARPPRGAVMGPAEAQNGDGMTYLLELGGEICDGDGDPLAPVALVLETYSRNAAGKHRCLELFDRHGVELPDTAVMALHRGRIDLLETHLRRDPNLLIRTFSHREIYPLSLGCHEDESLALHGAPLAGATLLHMSIDFGELEIAKWLLAQGMDANVRAVLDADGFGGHTPLFGCVVRMGLLRTEPLARLLLDHGADPNARASLRKRLPFPDDNTMYEYHDVTPLEWGRQFHNQRHVEAAAMKLIVERGGK